MRKNNLAKSKKPTFLELEFMKAAGEGNYELCNKFFEMGMDINLKVSGYDSPFYYILNSMNEKLIFKALDLKPNLSHLINENGLEDMTYIDWLLYFYNDADERTDKELSIFIDIFIRLAHDGCNVSDFYSALGYFKHMDEYYRHLCRTAINSVLDRKMASMKKSLIKRLKKEGVFEKDKLIYDIAGFVGKEPIDVLGAMVDVSFENVIGKAAVSQIVLKHALGETLCKPKDYAVFEIGRAITLHESCYT